MPEIIIYDKDGEWGGSEYYRVVTEEPSIKLWERIGHRTYKGNKVIEYWKRKEIAKPKSTDTV